MMQKLLGHSNLISTLSYHNNNVVIVSLTIIRGTWGNGLFYLLPIFLFFSFFVLGSMIYKNCCLDVCHKSKANRYIKYLQATPLLIASFSLILRIHLSIMTSSFYLIFVFLKLQLNCFLINKEKMTNDGNLFLFILIY